MRWRVRHLTRNGFWSLSLATVTTLIAACAETGDPAADRAAAETAESRFAELEQRLLAAENVLLRGGVGSAGAVISGLEGEIVVASGNRAHIQFAGEFGGTNVTPSLVADGEQMWGGNGTQQFEVTAPPALNDGILLGFTRMGILHNLALLSAATPPDGTDGKIRDWVAVSNFSWGEPETLDGVATETLRFDVTVHGTPAAEVVLWLDQQSGLPVQREQMVRFPDGDMRVVEVYETVELDAPFESEKFVIP